MYGFYIHSLDATKFPIANSIGFDKSISFNKYFFGYKSFEKFKNDKVFSETKEYIIGIDGVILNLQSLKNSYAISDFLKLIINLFEKEGIAFVSKLKGVFSGFIFEKTTQKLFFFNDKTATKQVFYSRFDDNIVIAPNLAYITKYRSENKANNKLSVQASYHMLTFGGMIENQTLVKEVYKLGAGEYLSLKNEEFEYSRYYDFNDIAITIHDKTQAIDHLNDTFIEALKMEYEKDVEYGYRHLATLSGGLDSRMNVMLAKKMGYIPDTFCFSQSNYADETIARKIAKDLSLDFKFFPLDGGDYLKSLAEMVSINSGLQFYHGSAHYHYALQQMDIADFGLMHTGQIGDGILGGFVSKEKQKKYLSKTISNRFIGRVNVNNKILNSYSNEEMFKLYQRVFNLANYGSYMVEHHQTYLVSPFLDDDVIKVALSIDPKLKYNQNIYLDWINQFHPEITKYKWERTGFRPNKAWKTSFSRYTNKIKTAFLLFTNQKEKLSMNPTDYWFETNQTIKEFYNNFFNTNIRLVEANKEIFSDLESMFTTGNVMEKALVLTLLEAVRKFKLSI